MKGKPRILIVDDDRNTQVTFEGMLMAEGYNVDCVSDGETVFSRLDTFKPDLILLDVMMPGMDGFEVCRRLKAHQRWRMIPVVMATALDSEEDLIRGLESGADDFVHKPVLRPELRARIRSVLRVKQQYDALEKALNTREMLSNAIVHNLKHPLAAILSSGSTLESLFQSTPRPSPQMISCIDRILKNVHRLESLTTDLFIIAKVRTGRLLVQPKQIDLKQLVIDTSNQHIKTATSRGTCIHLDLPQTQVCGFVDELLIQRVLDTLIANAVKFSNREGAITLRVVDEPGSPKRPMIRVEVQDQGPGIAPENQSRIFDFLEAASLQEIGIAQNTGLGLAFCKLIMEAHGGQMWVESEVGCGATFFFTIPTYQFRY